jgi:cytochrome c oxidase subunit 1
MDERLGKINFWTTFIGFNATFFPMHFLGLEGMPRRYYSYGENSGWWFWNVVVSFGAFFLGASILLFLYNVGRSLIKGEIASDNPWDGSTLEWATSSPPPPYNFATVPHVYHRDPLWAEKYGIHTQHDESDVDLTIAGVGVGKDHAPDEDVEDQEERRMRADDVAPEHIHLPNPSFYPIVAAFGMFLLMFGLITDKITLLNLGPVDVTLMSIVGLALLFGGIFGWSFEPAE